MGGIDRALMLGLPGLAVLAAFALPTLQRSTAAAIDWFSVFFFSICAITIWVIYAAMQTGVPAQPAANVARLAPGFQAPFSLVALLFAAAGTVLWIALVRWRTGRQRHAMWKSLVLPAGGVALCWLLLMTLWLPVLDYARSSRTLVERLERHMAGAACVAAPGVGNGIVASLEVFGTVRVDARAGAAQDGRCPLLLRVTRGARPRPPGLDPGCGRTAYDRPQRALVSLPSHGRPLTDGSDGGALSAPGTERRTRAAGKTRRKREPLPSSLWTSISPPCRCTTCLTMARPRPVPPVSRERLPSTR